MIRVTVSQYPYDIDPKCSKYLTFKLDNESVIQLKELLHRALNTAPPDKYPDWVDLADKLETLK